MFCSEIKSPAKQVFGDQNKSSSNQIFGDENKEPSAWGAIETPMCDVRVTDSPVSSQLSPIVCQVVGAPLSEELNTCSAMEGSDPSKEKNSLAGQKDGGGLLEVYIKWESGNLIKGLKLLRNSCLSDLRKLIEAHFEEVGSKQQQQQFIFLLLGVCHSALSMSCFHPSALCYVLLITMALIYDHVLSWGNGTHVTID
jgi:kinesin family member 11